jgi:hypothetical protein
MGLSLLQMLIVPFLPEESSTNNNLLPQRACHFARIDMTIK